ncbi:hypothetical protein VTO73DRAFT_5732 [Trametes versicolor]
MSDGPEYDPDKTTPEQLLERKAPAGDIIQLYHGTDEDSAQKIKAHGPKRLGKPFHDFAMGRDTAFYMTTMRETAVLFAKERAETLAGAKAAVVSITMRRDKVVMYEFAVDKVNLWRELVDYNRDTDREENRPQHVIVQEHNVVAGWISTKSKTHGRVPVAYKDQAGVYHFDWQYVVVQDAALEALGEITVELV